MRTSLRFGILCLLAGATARATVIAGTSTTEPLPYNSNNTYVFIFGGPGSQLAVPFTSVPSMFDSSKVKVLFTT